MPMIGNIRVGQAHTISLMSMNFSVRLLTYPALPHLVQINK